MTSDCVKDLSIKIVVFAYGWAIGAGLDFSYSLGGSYVFEDHSQMPNPDAFKGWFSITSFGGSIGSLGSTYEIIRLGSATSNSDVKGGYGIGGGITGLEGYTIVFIKGIYGAK